MLPTVDISRQLPSICEACQSGSMATLVNSLVAVFKKKKFLPKATVSNIVLKMLMLWISILIGKYRCILP